MSDIVLSGATRANLLALQNTTAMQSTVQNRLATGKKVNSALDNATSFFTAANFTGRATSLTSLLDSMSTGVQTLQAANTGIGSITKLVAQLRSTAQQALQSASAFTSQAKITSAAVSGSTAADIRGRSAPTAATATSTNTVAAAALSSFARASNQATNALSSLTDAQVAKVTGTATSLTPATSGTTTLSINDGSGATVYTYDTTATSSDATKFSSLTDLNTKLATAGKKVTAGFTGGGGAIEFKGTDTSVATVTVTEGGTSNTLGLGAAGNRTAGSSLTVGTKTLTYDSTGAGGANTFSSISDLNTKLASENVTATAGAGGRLLLTSTTDAGTFTASGAAATALGLTSGLRSPVTADTLTIADGATTAAFTFKSDSATGDNTTFKDIADLNTKLQALGSKARATDDGGKLKLTSTDTTSTLTTTGTAATKLGGLATPAAPGSTSSLDGKTLSFTVGTGTPLTVTFGDPAVTPGTVKTLDDLNTRLATIGLAATLDGTGTFSITTTAATASQSFTMGGSGVGAGQPFTTPASTNPTRGGTGADSRDNLVTQYNSLLTQINTLAKDAGFNGINLLAGDTLSLIFNESNTSRIDIAGTSANADGLGLTTIVASDLNDGNAIGSVLKNLDRVSGQLSNQASRLGSQLAVTQTRQDFTKQMVNTLKVGADNLVNADMNEEGANLLALNTQQQISQQALSLATQSAQAVLQLLRGG